jgi:hypothetical protein
MESAVHLRDRLKDCRAAIVDRWKVLALGVYPERAARFIARERDRFQNPVGHVMGESLGILYDGILDDSPAEEMRRALDGIVRIRAVQDLSPAEGVGFVFLLKQAIGEALHGSDADLTGGIGLAELHERIDRLALEAFDLFVHCRETIYELRVREIRSRTSTLLERLKEQDTERPDGTRC